MPKQQISIRNPPKLFFFFLIFLIVCKKSIENINKHTMWIAPLQKISSLFNATSVSAFADVTVKKNKGYHILQKSPFTELAQTAPLK